MSWEKKPLGEIINLKRGYDLPSQKRKYGYVPIISSSGITDFHSEPAKTGEGVVTGRYGTLGQLFYINGDYWPLNTTLYVQDFKGNIPKFIYYFLKTLSLEKFNAASAVPGLDRNVLHKIDVNFISHLPTQRKIASILSAYDDLIENNLKRIKLLEEKAFASYKLIVQNEKLEEFTIEELANVVMGQSPTSDTYTNEKEDNLPFHQGVSNFSNYFVEHKIFCKAPIKIAEEGDILFSVRAPVGRINFTSDKICIGRGLCAFRSKNGFQNYFYHQLKEFFFAEDVIGNGAIFNAVTKVELMKVKLKTPSEKIQQEFELEAQQMFNLILNLTKQNTKLREARDILLPKLMNGQIEV
jgi:type I restriction enzyme S subunit